jgi:ribonucleoside-diphosphate reductase alpha chain
MATRLGHGRGLTFSRRFTEPATSPYDLVAWESRGARITNDRGEVIFEQGGVEVPMSWSQVATNVVVSRYFNGRLGSPQRERSVRQLIERVVTTIARWGEADGYFATTDDARVFEAELTHLVLNQMGAFNSPVWRHVGASEAPQCSACFINRVDDDIESIMTLAQIEAKLFKGGSGTGTNLSPLRSSREPLSGGGTASGPVSFMKGFDAFAGVILEGGTTRPASKIALLDVDHPDLREFVRCKAESQRKAWALRDAGHDAGRDGAPGGGALAFEHTDTCVRLTDEFLAAVAADARWAMRGRIDGRELEVARARELLRDIAAAIHESGAPAVQFDTTINGWNTCPAGGRINASTPCGEFMFLDDTACNLSALNLMAFFGAGAIDAASLRHAIDLLATAQDIIVDRASYPTEVIARNCHRYRPLGVGFANLGALLLAHGLPYDSARGRALAAAIAALMTGEAYAQGARMAERLGPFEGYERDRAAALAVLGRHATGLGAIDAPEAAPLVEEARRVWDEALARAARYGLRNAQATALAPTSTISFMMDCDTTGVEPELSLVKFRRVGGGDTVKIVSPTVVAALASLGYEPSQARQIVEHAEEHGTIEDAPGLRPEHLAVFDCAARSGTGRRSVAPEGHVRMMAALQPFISGAISKTITLPADATVEEVERLLLAAHQLGLKSIAIHREGSSRRPERVETPRSQAAARPDAAPRRLRLPDERRSVTHKFSIAGHEGYITVGMYDDGSPGEIFIRMAKAGSVVAGLMDSFGLAISLSLQYGVPLQVLVDKYSHSRFEPSGFTTNPQIPIAKSIMDYIFRWLGMKFAPSGEPGPIEDLGDEAGDPRLPEG